MSRAVKYIFTVLVMSAMLSGCSMYSWYKPTIEEMTSADYGRYPENYEQIVKNYMQARLFDPYSAVYRFSIPFRSYVPYSETLQETIFCYEVRCGINAKNRMGGYTGENLYSFWIRNDRIVEMLNSYESPVQGDVADRMVAAEKKAKEEALEKQKKDIEKQMEKIKKEIEKLKKM